MINYYRYCRKHNSYKTSQDFYAEMNEIEVVYNSFGIQVKEFAQRSERILSSMRSTQSGKPKEEKKENQKGDILMAH